MQYIISALHQLWAVNVNLSSMNKLTLYQYMFFHSGMIHSIIEQFIPSWNKSFRPRMNRYRVVTQNWIQNLFPKFRFNICKGRVKKRILSVSLILSSPGPKPFCPKPKTKGPWGDTKML